ncbi:MAG: PilN domain-containing protein [bacterium]|nr:PilN domain-containing protein [bacterium]
MLVLNLISEKFKKEIKLKYFYQLIKKINYILIIIVITITTILLFAKIILQNNFIEIVEQTTLVTKNNQNYNNKIKEINNKLKAVLTIQNDFILWSKIIEDISIITPANITLSLVKMDLANKNIKLQGKAKQRSDLLELKNNLEKSTFYTNIEFPVKNLLEKENINFEINAKINQ